MTPEERAAETIGPYIMYLPPPSSVDLTKATLDAIRATRREALEEAAELMFTLYSDEERDHIRAMIDKDPAP